jgi:threonine dehydratase/serine racemase
VRGYGAEIIECEPTLAGRETTARVVIEETGGTFLHPYNHRNVIAGQGTVALELLEDVPDLDAIIAPVGGGGLISGISIAALAVRPTVRILAGEPKGADDAARSKAARKLIPQTSPDTIADGLLTSLGDLTWPIVRDLVERILTVTDDDIVRAMRLVWERMKLVIEPSAAVPLAAVLSDKFRELDGIERLGIVFSGGNVDLEKLPW